MIDERATAHYVVGNNGRDMHRAFTWLGLVWIEAQENCTRETTVAFSPQGAREMAETLNLLADAAEWEAALGMGAAAEGTD